MTRLARIITLAAALLAALGVARAQVPAKEDTLKIAIGQHGNWENSAPELGQRIREWTRGS